VVKFLISFSSPSALPLYLAAIFLYEGPFLVLSRAWHLKQPLLLASALAASASTPPGDGGGRDEHDGGKGEQRAGENSMFHFFILLI